ncbi:MAG: glutamate 5-kinase, partial [Nitrososphaeria archaeon]
NENDAVSVRELLPVNPYVPDDVRFGDNDRLSAIIASKVRGRMLIFLSDVDGYYETAPDGSRTLVKEIKVLNNAMIKFAKGQSAFGRGGMKSKLEAAKIVAETGIPVVIANGRRPNVIKDILDGVEVGTKILPVKKSFAN